MRPACKKIATLDTQVLNLYDAIASGLVDDHVLFRTKLNALQHEREECIRHESMLDTEAPTIRKTVFKHSA